MTGLQHSLLNRKERCIVHIGDVEVEKFPMEFEGIFLVRHMLNHVYAEGLEMRQVMDYGLWICLTIISSIWGYLMSICKMHMTEQICKIF